MIDKRFLFFLTKDSFELFLSANLIDLKSIVFIKQEGLIWTHGTYFGCTCNGEHGGTNNNRHWVFGNKFPIIFGNGTGLSEYATKEDLLAYQPKLVSGINIKTINDQSLLGSGNINIAGGSGLSGTSNYDQQISNLQQTVTEIQQLLASIHGGSSEGVRHSFLTQTQYDSLSSYDNNTIYFIIERTGDNDNNDTWVFGDELPIIF